jgi:amino acid permease
LIEEGLVRDTVQRRSCLLLMDVKIGSQFRDSEVAVSGKQQAAPSSSPLASTIRKHVEHQAPSSKWYHATSHVVAAMVGAGVLGLTWPGGIIALAVAFAVTLYTSHQLVNMFSLNEERHPTYRAVASVAFGRWAPLVVLPFQIFVTVGTGIAYVILFGTLARSMFVLVTPHSGDGPKLLVWFSIYIGCQCVLSLLPSLEKVRVLSFVALLASIGYCVIAIILCGALGVQPDVQYSVPDSSGTGITSGILLALGK